MFRTVLLLLCKIGGIGCGTALCSDVSCCKTARCGLLLCLCFISAYASYATGTGLMCLLLPLLLLLFLFDDSYLIR